MNLGRTVFSQLMDLFPYAEFRQCVARYRGDFKVQSFSCLDQFLCMAFAQLTYRESLRDIEVCLRAMESRLYHVGFRGKVSRNTLAHANEQRDWRIYADLAQVLIGQARRLYTNEPFAVELTETVYALDTTIIDLCLALFPWAPFQQSKAALKLHTLLALHGNIPTFVEISHGRISDVSVLDQLSLEAGSFYVMDRGYVHFARLYRFTLAAAFFVVRGHINMKYRRRYSRAVDKSTGLRCDQTVILTGKDSTLDYPANIRRIRFVDPEQPHSLVFITNNFTLPALTVTQLYKSRWQVELFFKWIKQHLRIKAFYGRSANAVKTQVWVALSVYLLLAILKKHHHLPLSLYTITQILSLTLFEKTPLLQALTHAPDPTALPDPSNQFNLFE
jgi:hypothetical protein